MGELERQCLIGTQIEQVAQQHAGEHGVTHNERQCSAKGCDSVERLLRSLVGIGVALASREPPAVLVCGALSQRARVPHVDVIIGQTGESAEVNFGECIKRVHRHAEPVSDDCGRISGSSERTRTHQVTSRRLHERGHLGSVTPADRRQWRIEPPLSATLDVPLGLAVTGQQHSFHRNHCCTGCGRRRPLFSSGQSEGYVSNMDQICDDLAAEHAALDAVVAEIDEAMWSTDTPAEGWDVKDTIVHLIQADMAASLAVTDADGFATAKEQMMRGSGGLDFFASAAGKTGAEVLTLWRDERAKMLDAFRARAPKDRIPWFGPDMSTLSFATARLMETWSHGQDVADTVGVAWPATERLKHVCHIGVTTRGWSYMVRGMDFPGGDVRVELNSPAGELWTWGPDDAADRITGSAEEFCLVATQRRQPSSTNLVAEGPLATEWLGIAQAFAGEPTLPDGR